MKYYIIHRCKNIAIAFPEQFKNSVLCDKAIILNLKTFQYTDGVQVRNDNNLKILNDKDILNCIRCWNYHKINKKDIINI